MHGVVDTRPDVVRNGGRIAHWVERSIRAIVRMTVAGKVDHYERLTQRQGDRVPGMGVLAAAVQENDLCGLVPPDEPGGRPAVRCYDIATSNLRRTVPAYPEL